MFISPLGRPVAQRAVCLFLSLLIVSASLTLGAFGVESMVHNARQTTLQTAVRA